MITARSVVVATILIAVISLITVCIRMTRPPDSGGFGADTFGTHGHGFRGLHDLLAELDVPTDRSLVPPGAIQGASATLVFLAPSNRLVSIEPSHLHRVAEWVERGGRVVVTPENDSLNRSLTSSKAAIPESQTTVLAALGLVSVEISEYVEENDSNGSSAHAVSGREKKASARLKDMFKSKERALKALIVEGESDYAPLAKLVRNLAVPEDRLHIISDGLSEAEAILYVADRTGERHAVAARFAKGEGKIVVMSDPTLWQNRAVAQAGNAVMAAHLLSEPGHRIVFDEFYHGLSIRGNPLWLLTRRSYAQLAVVVFIGCAIAVWRGAIFLGPPIAERRTRRRAIGEYVDAMARLFRRGRDTNRFVLSEVRGGAMWKLRCDLNLAPGKEELDMIAPALARREPHRAEKFVATIQKLDRSLSTSRTIRDREATLLLREISDCL